MRRQVRMQPRRRAAAQGQPAPAAPAGPPGRPAAVTHTAQGVIDRIDKVLGRR